MAEQKPIGRRRYIENLAPLRAKSPQTGAQGGTNEPAGTPPIPFRVGHGYDLHKLQAGGKTLLGGVVVSEEFSPVAHSDGDVVLHALVDAILGAMGWGDIGELFPDTDDKWKGAASRTFVETVAARVGKSGYRVRSVDVTILAERPRLKDFKSKIVDSIRRYLGSAGDGASINVKAGTNEGCDAVGRGEAIAAHAIVLLGNEE